MVKSTKNDSGNSCFKKAIREKLFINQAFIQKAYKKTTLVKLHNDHVNACILLDILEEELKKIETCDELDFLLIQDIVYYMVNYPDNVHHPLEEVIFKKLEQKDPSSRIMIEQLYKEHTELAMIGDELAYELEKIIAGSILGKDDIVKLCRKYLNLLSSHMNNEEDIIFPRVDRLFSFTDWAEINTSLETIEDPLFGKALQKRFKRLYRMIITKRKPIIKEHQVFKT